MNQTAELSQDRALAREEATIYTSERGGAAFCLLINRSGAAAEDAAYTALERALCCYPLMVSDAAHKLAREKASGPYTADIWGEVPARALFGLAVSAAPAVTGTIPAASRLAAGLAAQVPLGEAAPALDASPGERASLLGALASAASVRTAGHEYLHACVTLVVDRQADELVGSVELRVTQLAPDPARDRLTYEIHRYAGTLASHRPEEWRAVEAKYATSEMRAMLHAAPNFLTATTSGDDRSTSA